MRSKSKKWLVSNYSLTRNERKKGFYKNNCMKLRWVQLENLTLSLPESIMQTFSVVVTFESVDEIL